MPGRRRAKRASAAARRRLARFAGRSSPQQADEEHVNDEADKTEETPLDRQIRIRAERKKALQAQADAQRAQDLEKINELEVEHGDTNVIVLDVPYTPGLPTCVAARTPTDPEIKRYRHRVNEGRKGQEIDPKAAQRASEELADVVVIFPSKDDFEAICKARPAVRAQLGAASTKLSQAREEAEGKA
jgi:hypothetical protein